MGLLTFVTLVHLTGLIMGLGGAILADFTTLTRGVIRPVSDFTIHQVEFLSRVVLIGLALLWTSGIAIVWLNTVSHPEYITNQKLWAKVIIVAVLTLNGFLVHKTVLPFLQQSRGYRLFDKVSRGLVAKLTLIGSVSVVSWVMPFILAKSANLNYVTPVGTILAVYGAAVLVTWLGMFSLMSTISGLQRLARRIATVTLQPSAAWEEAAFRLAA